MTDSKALIERLRADWPEILVEKHWMMDSDAIEEQRREAADYIEKLEADLMDAQADNAIGIARIAELEADNARLRERLAKYDELKAGIVGSRAALQETSHDA